MKSIGIFETKTHLSELLVKVQQGEVFTITKNGKPIAELRAAKPLLKKSIFGLLKGKIKIADDFDAPLKEFEDYQP